MPYRSCGIAARSQVFYSARVHNIGVHDDMTHHTGPQPDDRPRYAQADSTGGIAVDDEALLDHHIEEVLTAFSDLDPWGLPASGSSQYLQ
jgi:hypothetical protein